MTSFIHTQVMKCLILKILKSNHYALKKKKKDFRSIPTTQKSTNKHMFGK